MRNIFLSVVIAFTLGFFLASCSGFKQMEIDKRHYRNGFYIHHSGSVNNDAPFTATGNAAVETSASTSTVTGNKSEPVVNTTTPPQEMNTVVDAADNISPASSMITESRPAKYNSADLRETLPLNIHHSSEKTPSDDMLIIEILLCFLLPCVAVLLHDNGITNRFWIALLLMILLWIPGVIYALLVVTDSI